MDNLTSGSMRRARRLGLIHHHGDLSAKVFLVESERLFAVAAEVQLRIDLHRNSLLVRSLTRLCALHGCSSSWQECSDEASSNALRHLHQRPHRHMAVACNLQKIPAA